MPPARIVFMAATLGGIVVTVHAALTEPPSLHTAVAFVFGYMAIILAGVFVLRLRMFADAILRGPEDARGVVLTFDDGPDPVHTPKVLDALDARDAKATFFVIGKKADAHPEIVKQIIERGHEVGIHGYAHDRLFSLRGPHRVRRDLERAVKSLEKITGTKPTLFRPPIGHTNPTIVRIAEQLDLTIVGWSVAGYDGIARAKVKDVVARVRRGLEARAIVLLHDAAEKEDHEPVGPKALPEILDAIDAKALRVEKLRDWVAALD